MNPPSQRLVEHVVEMEASCALSQMRKAALAAGTMLRQRGVVERLHVAFTGFARSGRLPHPLNCVSESITSMNRAGSLGKLLAAQKRMAESLLITRAPLGRDLLVSRAVTVYSQNSPILRSLRQQDSVLRNFMVTTKALSLDPPNHVVRLHRDLSTPRRLIRVAGHGAVLRNTVPHVHVGGTGDWSSRRALLQVETPYELPAKVRAEELTECLLRIAPGREQEKEYHRLVPQILQFLFGDSLKLPLTESPVDYGLKRLDVRFANVDTSGFFYSLSIHQRVFCPWIFCECKNYSTDLRNPEVDQLLGRFHQRRGEFGFLAYRTAQDRDLLIRRCKAAVQGGRGYVLPLDDNDLLCLLDMAGKDDHGGIDQWLRGRFWELVS